MFSGTYAGNISGAGSLTKDGAGTVILSGANTYSGGTTVSAGSLQGDTTSLQGNIINNGNVTFSQMFSGTYAGNISGTGSVAVSSAGTVTLSGANTYTGGTTVSAGILQGDTTSLQGNITDNANVTFNQSTNGTYAGNISGTGSLTKSGTGTVTLSAPTPTAAARPSRPARWWAPPPACKATIVDNANVTFNQSTNGTYAGVMSGTGNLTLSGTGTVTLSGANTYSGGTTVSAGSLQGDTTSLQGNLVDNANVTFNQSTNGTYAGVLSGTGSLTKSGTGTVTLSGANTYSGGTTVAEGKLAINGSLISNTTVAAAGALGGNGTINGQVVNNGLIGPGNSIGTLHINGNFTSNQGSAAQIEINNGGTTPGVNNDLLAVNGNAIIQGGTVDVMAAPGSYSPATKYTFLTYTGTRTGTFDGVVDNLPLMTAELEYGNGFVQFELFRDATHYAALAQTFNQFQVATYLDIISPTATGDVAFVLDQLNMQTAAGARRAFQQMTGEVNATMAQLGVQNTSQVYLMLQRQLRPTPMMSGSSSAANDLEGPEIVCASYNPSTQQIEFVECSGHGGGCCPQWTGWITGYGLGGDAHGDGNSAGGVYGIGGTVFGLERPLDCCHTWGIFGAYSGLGLTIANPNQSSKANDCQFGNYLCGNDGFNYYLLAGSVGYDKYETSRQIEFGAVDRVALGEAGGWQASMWLERGVQFHYGCWDLQPLMALQYIYLRQGGFTETGADSLNLQVGGIDTSALRGILGAYGSQPIRLPHGQRLSLETRALWLHEFLEPDTSFNSTFAGTGEGSFITRGLNFGRDWAVLGGGLKWQLNSRLNIFADYDLQFNALQAFHVGSGGLEFVW